MAVLQNGSVGMDSLNILFTGRDQVEVRREPVRKLDDNELLIETHCSLISTGTEGICLQRKFAPGTHWDDWVKYPFPPGYSLVGHVLEVGKEVTGFKAGGRVLAGVPHGQFVIAGERSVYPIPDAISDEDATWGVLAYVVQHGVRKAQIQLGEVVVVVGLGMLGQLAVQYARAAGAGAVIGIDTAPKRLHMAADHGATHVLEMDVARAAEAVAEITQGDNAEIVFDMTGHPAVFAGALKLLRRFGKLVLIGDAGTPSEQSLTSDVIKRDLQIIAAHGGNAPPESNDYTCWTHAEMVRLFYRYLERGQMRVEDLITHRYAPANAPEAYGMLTTNRAEAMGVIFDFRSLSNEPGA